MSEGTTVVVVLGATGALGRALLCVLAIATASICADEPDTKSYPVLSGVGIALRESDGELFIGFVVPDSPADKSGRIHKGDRLVSVQSDDQETALIGKTVGEAASAIRGPSGTRLVLTLVPSNTEDETSVSMMRAPLAIAGIDDASYRSFIGKPAPEMVLSTLNGKSTTKLSDYLGKVVVLDFWASWCTPCRKSFPWLNTANTAYKSHGLKVVAVNVDKDKQLANDFLDKVDVSFPVLYDPDGRFAQAFQLKGMPSSFILDDKGEVLASHVGFFEDKIDIYEEKIESLLTH